MFGGRCHVNRTIVSHSPLNILYQKPLEIEPGSNGPLIGNVLWRVEHSCDLWRHVTLKGQTHDPNTAGDMDSTPKKHQCRKWPIGNRMVTWPMMSRGHVTPQCQYVTPISLEPNMSNTGVCYLATIVKFYLVRSRLCYSDASVYLSSSSRLSSSVCTECIVTKRCVLEQKLLLTASQYRKSFKKSMGTKTNDLDLSLGRIKVTSTIALHLTLLSRRPSLDRPALSFPFNVFDVSQVLRLYCYVELKHDDDWWWDRGLVPKDHRK